MSRQQASFHLCVVCVLVLHGLASHEVRGSFGNALPINATCPASDCTTLDFNVRQQQAWQWANGTCDAVSRTWPQEINGLQGRLAEQVTDAGRLSINVTSSNLAAVDAIHRVQQSAQFGHAKERVATASVHAASSSLNNLQTREEIAAKDRVLSTSAAACALGSSEYVQCANILGVQTLRSVAYKIAGTCGTDGTDNNRFKYIEGVHVAPDGTLYATDFGNGRIKKVTPPASGIGDWTQTVLVAGGGIEQPRGLLHQGGNSDSLLVVSASTKSIVQVGATNGSVLSTVATGFSNPGAIASVDDGHVLVTDGGNHHCVWRVNLHSGSKAAFAGTCGTSGQNSDGALLYKPRGVAVASNGDVFVADTGNHCIKKFAMLDGNVSVFAGSCGTTGTSSQTNLKVFNDPQTIDFTADGDLLVSDNRNYCVKRITPNGQISSVAGTCGVQGSDNGQGLRIMRALSFLSGTSFILSDNDSHCIKKVTYVP